VVPDKREETITVLKRTIKLKERKQLPRRHVRVNIRGRLAHDIEAYARLYHEAHGQEIELGSLVETIVEQFLESDHEFQRRRNRDESGSSKQS